MRTAKEIFDNALSHYASYEDIDKEKVLEVINEARKEAIEECAKVVKCKPLVFSERQKEYGSPAKVVCAIDKESILSLINKLQ